MRRSIFDYCEVKISLLGKQLWWRSFVKKKYLECPKCRDKKPEKCTCKKCKGSGRVKIGRKKGASRSTIHDSIRRHTSCHRL